MGYDLEDTYPQYHVLCMLRKFIGLSKRNATKFRKAFERDKLYKPLVMATKILYKLCHLVVKEQQKKSEKELGTNDVFGKTRGMLKITNKNFYSRDFSKKRKKFLNYIAKFKSELK